MAGDISNGKDSNIACARCAKSIGGDGNYLQCLKCNEFCHIKCLRHASTPGDLLGDVFFDFTCTKCVQMHQGDASSSTSTSVIGEKLVRQRMPWVMIITLALYNLSIKSKGLSHHGYFHWRTHIVSFIEKNWECLMGPNVRKPKKWIGSVSGALSHNSPDFFLSGQEVFSESGWWKLKHSKLTPRHIYKIYKKLSKKRAQQRSDKLQAEDISSDPSNSLDHQAEKTRRRRRSNSNDDFDPNETCSRAIPYMGRKPKVAKPLDITDEEINKNSPALEPQQQNFNTVQSHLMDFLAENLSNDDLMFNNLASISNVEPSALIGSEGGKNDFLRLMDENHENANFFDLPDMNGLNGFDRLVDYADTSTTNDKLKNADLELRPQINRPDKPSSMASWEENSNDENDDDDDNADSDDEFQPRIVQVTNFQQLDESLPSLLSAQNQTRGSIVNDLPSGVIQPIKKELMSDAEQSESEELHSHRPAHGIDGSKEHMSAAEASDDEALAGGRRLLPPCKPSLFNKHPHRKWPWLVQKLSDEEQDEYKRNEQNHQLDGNKELVLMSEYEEKQLLCKMRKIFAHEAKCQLDIHPHIRRFYRKLCVREWKREHGKPLFNLDNHFDPNYNSREDNSQSQIIDRYQLISLTPQEALKTFHARLAGSFDYEMFQSPFTQRILHPFIYRNTKCWPPWLKLMCELQFAVTGKTPTRSSIDYCYVRPNHIGAVNALLQSAFWPGIDMSDCLSYPDFSVVALYRKLVIGCAFLVPDVGYNEAYISYMAVKPGWQRCGIGKFMLYHLIQTCMSKDITLHVSATNPAVMLYQEFGFKIEEVILNFYDKYLPIDSKHSRHALFLRLTRS